MTTTEPNETDDGVRTERWVYLGEFEGVKVKTVASFRTPERTRSYRTSTITRRLAVGYIYEILCDDNRTRGEFKWTGDKAEDYDQLRMDARHREMERERAAMEDKARKGDPDLDALLAHVGEYAARFTKVSSREALIRLLERTVWRAQRK